MTLTLMISLSSINDTFLAHNESEILSLSISTMSIAVKAIIVQFCQIFKDRPIRSIDYLHGIFGWWGSISNTVVTLLTRNQLIPLGALLTRVCARAPPNKEPKRARPIVGSKKKDMSPCNNGGLPPLTIH